MVHGLRFYGVGYNVHFHSFSAVLRAPFASLLELDGALRGSRRAAGTLRSRVIGFRLDPIWKNLDPSRLRDIAWAACISPLRFGRLHSTIVTVHSGTYAGPLRLGDSPYRR